VVKMVKNLLPRRATKNFGAKPNQVGMYTPVKDMARIRDDYFTAIADDLTDEEAHAQIKELRELCDSIMEPS